VFGVRGVNTGVQDGNNLAWKLSSVVRGIAPPSLLDSFTHERLADAKRICFEAARSTRMMAPPSRGYRILRDAVLQLSVDHEFTRPLLHWRTSRPMDYADSPLTTTDPTESHFAAGPRPGATARNVCVNPDSAERSWLFDAFAPGFQVLVFGEHAETIQQVVDDIAALRGERVPVRLLSIQRASTPASVATDAVVLDPLGRIHETWGAAAGAVYVLRPDQHVAARWTLDSSARVAQVVRKALGREATAAAATTEIAEALA
jgi:3-(3-hydroxy-phenyl)propionate hydroxylase